MYLPKYRIITNGVDYKVQRQSKLWGFSWWTTCKAYSVTGDVAIDISFLTLDAAVAFMYRRKNRNLYIRNWRVVVGPSEKGGE